MNAIEVKNLVLKRDDFLLNDITMALPRGSVVGLVGRNGAGKTTLIEVIAGVIGVENGIIFYDGVPMWENEAQIKENLGGSFV